MNLIDQHTKAIMEECKVQAREAGLKFDNETLEYIVTNRNMIELSPKVMIPTLYDYWVNDVEVLKGIGKYKVFPHNPYETVINSRPAISFYNDNNPDWMNIMIFYHVLGHIDFFQNNILFENTWNDDFVGQALADKRLISSLRTEHGRWVDYAIEFSRCIDNLTGYFDLIAQKNFPESIEPSPLPNYYFDVFLQEEIKVAEHIFFREIQRYNQLKEQHGDLSDSIFFLEVKKLHPEFQAKYEKYHKSEKEKSVDILDYIIKNSPFIKKEENQWIRSVLSVIRNTALYFEPQIRTKTINEGWASYWHDKLFIRDKRIKGHESAYAKLNAGVTSISRIGLNPYAIGLRLIQYVEELANKGKFSFAYQKNKDLTFREQYDLNTSKGMETIFDLRKYFSDFTLINTFVDQDFVDLHDLFVVGQRYNPSRNSIEYFVKSRKAEDYKKMLIDSLYHPPRISINHQKTDENNLYLIHKFENKQLLKDYIPETMMGIEYLWGGQVQLETTNIIKKQQGDDEVYEYRKVLYTMKNKKISMTNL